MKSVIETALPLSELNAKTINEKGAGGALANLHPWWGRSSITSCSAAIEAALRKVDGSENEELPTVFDPFSGFGAIPLAAEQLGLPVIAGDLNPVAVMLTKAATEIPSAFAKGKGIDETFCDGTKTLAEDVDYYGKWMLARAQENLEALYPTEPEVKPFAWLWARSVKCPNPACNCEMPLASTFILNGKAGSEAWAEPVVEDGKIHFEIRSGICPKDKESNKFSQGAAIFRCPACGELTTDEYIKKQGQEKKFGSMLMAVSVETKNGRVFVAPSERQITAADVPMPEDIPEGEIPNNAHWFSPPGFGLQKYSELFSNRQLTMLSTFCDLLKEVQDKAASDALAAGMSPTGGSLAQGGRGALAYGQAISVYLAFVIDKLADSNSTICTWRTNGGNIRNTFGRQSIPMTWTYAEGNPFSSITGNYKACLKNVVDAIRSLPIGHDVKVYQGDAETTEFPKNMMVCTELPYYRAIGYAHLSDFFYIWMRRSLKPIFPDLFNPMVTPKEELSTVGIYYGEDAKTCVANYQAKLRKIIEKFYDCSNPDYPTLLFFEFHKADEAALLDETITEPTAWENILNSLIKAKFAVNAIWPMRTEPADSKADGFRVLIVARKQESIDTTTRRAFVNTLKREMPAAMETAFSKGVDDCDKPLVALGCGLSIYSRYWHILNADGTDMSVHDALPMIYQKAMELISITNSENTTEQVEEEN